MGGLVEVCETYRLETGRESMSDESQRILATVRAFSEGMVSQPEDMMKPKKGGLQLPITSAPIKKSTTCSTEMSARAIARNTTPSTRDIRSSR